MLNPSRIHFPFVALAIIALLAALWAGLLRLGWQFPPLIETLADAHGPLMISGFLGTLVSLERAVALRLGWSYAAPLAAGLGALGLIGGAFSLSQVLMTLASLVMLAISITIVMRQRAAFTAMLALGAVCWLIGNLLWWSGHSISESVPWWAGFLLLTIAGERLELGRFVRVSANAQAAFVAIMALFTAGLITTLFNFNWGMRIAGVGLVALAAWLLRNDIARRTVRSDQGITRFVAICMLAGYFWLGIGGLFWAATGVLPALLIYDASLHTLFLGFVFSMIFGHMPIILPAVLGTAIRMNRSFYLHLVLLELSLILRLAGDLLAVRVALQWGGMLNAIAILVFLANTLRAVRQGARGAKLSLG